MRAFITHATLAVALMGAAAHGLAMPLQGAEPRWPGASPPAVGIEQHLGATLPLGLSFTDHTGRARLLSDFADGRRPIVLVLGYARCAQLCGSVMRGVLQALKATGLPPDAYRIVGVSIDPKETPAMAARRRTQDLGLWRQLEAGAPTFATAPSLDLLTGTPRAVAALAARVGFQYVVPSDGSGIAHAAGFMVATPQGRLSRYFMGVAFEPRALRLALIEASNGRIGTLTERLALRCLHFDPSQGRYSLDILNGLRVMGLGLAAALAWWMWRHRAARVRSTA